MDYVGLSEGRMCTLNSHKRELIYDIFLDYEKLKLENCEFDVADLVIDLHRRLKNGKYVGDMMDFVYIDEVQDLTMSQIALFKYICQNVEEGFVFSGDTAQTIARGIDFRFEDIRSLFYNEFILESKSEGNDGKKEKGQISRIFHLSQNFRTHDGVLRLGQSVIDLLYRFFPFFIDVLSHETSLIYGEPPIWLDSGKDENAVATIFGNIENGERSFVGFGAEQVILVRDDSAKNEIVKYVGKHALILTVVECKGLEFQDVLLYNFFSSSPLRNQWRVIYEYMNEQGLLDGSSPRSFPSFNRAKHNVLCSELKQLYVAITRTRQRFWICENMEEFSKPMFEYWKKKCLIEVRELDDSLAQAMQVASTPEEWKSRGYKLLREGNYEMATMCFEKAADKYGEKLAKATGLKAAADRMHFSNPEMFSITCREAAEIFNSIGKAALAAECFYMLKDYETAGKIYLEKCSESFLERAGECFLLSKKYESAAEVYARASNFSKCLSCCAKGELFEMGLQYIKDWKQHTSTDDELLKRRKEMEKVEQEFLENCASHFHLLNDNITMMKYVRAFHSMASVRTFLKSLGCLDDLLAWEIESGNFLEAADIAKQRVELPLAADLLGKCGHYKDASMLILWFVFANSLWSAQSTGWPLKPFKDKEELLAKAKSFAKNETNQFYEFICAEADTLSSERSNILVLKQQLDRAQSHRSIRGEILSARKILDSHFVINTSKYVWEDEMIFDLTRHSEDILNDNQVSVETLVYFWNYWKDKVVQIFEYLKNAGIQDVTEYRSYGDFCLNYLGVWRQFNNLDTLYILLKSNVEWVSNDRRFLQNNGNLFSIGINCLVSTARNYWRSELFSVGLIVLKNLEALYKDSIKNNFSFFRRSLSLTHICEVANFLLKPEFLSSRYNAGTLQDFIRISTKNILDCIFHLNWQEALKDNLIHLRGTETLRKLLEEVAFEIINSKNKIYYGEIGRLALIILGSGKVKSEMCLKIAERLRWNQPWNAFFKNLRRISNFHEVVVDTYNANWRRNDYISPGCFLYLLDRYVFLLSCLKKVYIYTTKFSLIEWLICQEGNTQSADGLVDDDLDQQTLEHFLIYIVETILKLLYNEEDTALWIKHHHKNVNECYSLLVSRLIVLLCLLYLNFQNCFPLNLLVDLLQKKRLPSGFFDAIHRGLNYRKPNEKLFAEAFKKTGNPLVIFSVGEFFPKRVCTNAIYVEMKAQQTTEDILKVLVPPFTSVSKKLTGLAEVKATNLCRVVISTDNSEKSSNHLSSNSSSLVGQGSSNCNKNEGNLRMNHLKFWEILDALKSQDNVKDKSSSVVDASVVKVELDRCINVLIAATNGSAQKSSDSVDLKLIGQMRCMIVETKELRAALQLDSAFSDLKGSDKVSSVEELCKTLQSRRPTMEPVLNQLYLQQNITTSDEDSGCQFCPENGNGKTEESTGNDDSKSEKNCSRETEEKASKVNADSGNNQAVEKKGQGGGGSKSKKKKKGKGKRK
ncbi:uncharacterized protein LOC110823594 [Carica papaya]|uniref:uncharacterized protein LOC110823594 n=1 Tax=Carica papaya TaxID=3649 RepID=UPI000B8CDE88|nr:uncharacterized protein LOC110823594 [Carica papaya]